MDDRAVDFIEKRASMEAQQKDRKNNILLRTNVLVCLILIVGFVLTAILSYKANYSESKDNIEQVSSLTSEGVYYQMTRAFTKPIHISLTMANDSFLKDFLREKENQAAENRYIWQIREYLNTYQQTYGYDSVFLVSEATGHYYNFNGMDRVLTPDNPENVWYYTLIESDLEYDMVVDNDEVAGADNALRIFVNCKITDGAGAVMGVVGVGLSIDTFQSMMQSYEEEFGGKVYLLDDNGVIQVSSDHTGYEKDAVGFFDRGNYSSDLQEQILGWKEGENEYSLWTRDSSGNKNNSYMVSRYLPELGWHLVVEQDTRALRKQLNRQFMQTIIIIALIILGILFIITYVIRSFNRQIVMLTRSIEQERKTMFERATEEMFEDIYEMDITNNRPANHATEKYFESLGAGPNIPFDKALQIVAEKQIKQEFRQGYVDTFTPENVKKAFERGESLLRYEFMISQGGDYYWMRITARLVLWESDGTLHMLVYRQNIDAEKKQEQRLTLLMQTDEMTGFLTKTATKHHIKELMDANPMKMYALFILDIDDFKTANDRFGHAFGDGIIEDFTGRMREQLGKDSILGRIGGDEFAAFVPTPSVLWTEAKCRILLKALEQSYDLEGKQWKMTASIGVAFVPTDGTDYDTIYRKADKALYHAKEKGKNKFAIYDCRIMEEKEE